MDTGRNFFTERIISNGNGVPSKVVSHIPGGVLERGCGTPYSGQVDKVVFGLSELDLRGLFQPHWFCS